MPPRVKFFLLPLAASAIIFVVGFALYRIQTPTRKTRFESAFREASALHARGDGRAVYKYREALANAGTPQEEAVAMLNVGTALFSSDEAEAAATLKKVYANTAYPPRIRAAAVHHLVEWYSNGLKTDFAEKYFFVGGEPWESFLPSGTARPLSIRDANQGMLRAEEHATDLYSLFQSEYAVAFLYSKYGVLENLGNEVAVAEFVEVVQDRIRRGDAAVLINDLQRDSQYGWGYQFKAAALKNLYQAGAFSDTQAIVDTYGLAIAAYERVPRIPVAYSARLFEVIFLASLGDLASLSLARERLDELFVKGAFDTNASNRQRFLEIVQNARRTEGVGAVDGALSLDGRFAALTN